MTGVVRSLNENILYAHYHSANSSADSLPNLHDRWTHPHAPLLCPRVFRFGSWKRRGSWVLRPGGSWGEGSLGPKVRGLTREGDLERRRVQLFLRLLPVR